MKALCGYILDEECLKQSSSGGLASAISRYAIKNGAVVYGVSYTSDLKAAEYIRVDNLDGLNRLQGSKYFKVYHWMKSGIIEQLILDIKDKKVFFFGLPCDIGVLICYLNRKNIKTENLITIDLICHGATKPEVHEQYIDMLEKKYNSKVIEFSVRYKNPDWKPAYIRAKFSNEDVFVKKFHSTEYGEAFVKMSCESCYDCRFKGENHISDITIGDYWGCTKEDECWNSRGVSLAFINTDLGQEVVEKLDTFKKFNANIEIALKNNPYYLCSREKHIKYDKFCRIFKECGLKVACRKTRNFKEIIKKIIRWKE